jgi:hypothetical protein
MKLREGEQIVLDDGYLGFRRKLTLTNQRLIFWKKHGFFMTSWAQEEEIPLTEIEEAQIEPSGAFELSTAMLKMKNDQSIELVLKLPESQSFEAHMVGEKLSGMHQRLKTIKDSWVDAINSQLMAKAEDRTQELEDRNSKLREKPKEK